jgi:hypothetical protein
MARVVAYGGANQGAKYGHGVPASAAAELPADNATDNATRDRRQSGASPVSGTWPWFVFDLCPAFSLWNLVAHVPIDRFDVHYFGVLVTIMAGQGQGR